MSSRAWISSLPSNAALFDKPGVRAKLSGREWDPAQFEFDAPGDELMSVLRKHGRGFELPRNELPEAAAVWNDRYFKRTKDIFAIAGFYAVKGRLAEALSRFDMGEGGLVPFPLYKADLATPYPDEYFFLNFGALKNTILPGESKNVVKLVFDKKEQRQIWKVNSWAENNDVVLGSAAVDGADFWHEELITNKFFLSDPLAQAVVDIGLGDAFKLKECRIV